MSVCGFSVKEYYELYYIAYYDNIENIQSSFALFNTVNNTVIMYKDIYYDSFLNKIRLKNKVFVNNAKDLKEICLNIAKTYKELKIIQKKKELEKDFT